MLFFDADLLGPWVAERSNWQYVSGMCTAIGRIQNGRIVGGVLYERDNGESVWMHAAGEGAWINKRLLEVAFDYPFNQLKVKYVIAMVEHGNAQVRKLIERLGFECKAHLPGTSPNGGFMFYQLAASTWQENRNGRRRKHSQTT